MPTISTGPRAERADWSQLHLRVTLPTLTDDPAQEAGTTMPAPDYERRLIENIQPIRQFFLANVLHHALQLGVFRALADDPHTETAELAKRLDLDARRLGALLAYLQNENYVLDDGGWILTPRGQALPTFAPWYQMLVGGYGTTFQQLGHVLRPNAAYATRDTTQVGAGSCGIGVTDTLPLALHLLDAADTHPTTLVDLGCGDAGFLIEILNRRPGLKGIGVEPNPGSVERALELRRREGLTDRLQIVQATAADVAMLDLPDHGRGAAFMTAFVLQEMLEQDGERAVEDLLRATFDTYPDARWIVVEMDYQPNSPLLGAHGLGQAFYNPYFLIHNITEQRLETSAWWAELFRRANLTAATATTDPRVDSTGMEIGFLLARPLRRGRDEDLHAIRRWSSPSATSAQDSDQPLVRSGGSGPPGPARRPGHDNRPIGNEVCGQ